MTIHQATHRAIQVIPTAIREATQTAIGTKTKRLGMMQLHTTMKLHITPGVNPL